MWRAARLKEKTGIDPLTVSQTTCRRGSGTVHLSALPSDQPAGTLNLVVDLPPTLRPIKGWRVIEARSVGEAVTSVPFDRVAIRPGVNVALMLPLGRYGLTIIDLREIMGEQGH